MDEQVTEAASPRSKKRIETVQYFDGLGNSFEGEIIEGYKQVLKSHKEVKFKL